MHFISQKKSLLNAISIVQKAVSSKSTLPILKGIYIEAVSNHLKFIATDLEIGIEHIIESNILEEGTVVVDARLFSEIVRKLPDSEVEILLKEQQMIIKCQNSEFNILYYPSDEFPELPTIEQRATYEINNQVFKNMIRQTSFATSQDEMKPVFTGVLVEIIDNKLNMVALDGYRLALKKVELTEGYNNKAIIPAKTLNEIGRIMDDSDDTVYMTLSDKHALFTLGETKLISRLLEGEFINYKQIIPKEYKTRIKVSTSLLLDSVERAALISREGKNNPIKLNIVGDKLIITSNSEVGKVQEEIDIETEGEDLNIAFNSKYLLDVLKIIEDEFLFIDFMTSINPGLIRPEEDINYKYLILPVRVSE
ncbi:DNA polymerase III subunit beta [Serpentinicella alkaliphila]|uniref:Beta sliding clamp n=1 Tax=Serpentinicella alkaliphila TaxID=1734049 RepID=A0A4R2TGE5_9FIRM|nr:DNA polymerase III subunit beta [Serpentinicella alkaliphila]QUH25142.1 DNA polymerase III subunit beta [Serpentinicella alkaliphila]TCQ02231.1 DNA polymerase III beta subunit [Serpentinicella alkaliphila]